MHMIHSHIKNVSRMDTVADPHASNGWPIKMTHSRERKGADPNIRVWWAAHTFHLLLPPPLGSLLHHRWGSQGLHFSLPFSSCRASHNAALASYSAAPSFFPTLSTLSSDDTRCCLVPVSAMCLPQCRPQASSPPAPHAAAPTALCRALMLSTSTFSLCQPEWSTDWNSIYFDWCPFHCTWRKQVNGSWKNGSSIGDSLIHLSRELLIIMKVLLAATTLGLACVWKKKKRATRWCIFM
jgi:hypothetical protein